jgi:predicted Zn-ribbon and HTH transcriptional regulator
MPKLKTHEQFCKEVYDLIQDEYVIKTTYKNTATKVLLIHNKCGNEWWVSPRDFLSGKRCPQCQHRSFKKATKEFKEEVFNLVGNEYTVNGEYVTSKIKIPITHNTCGNTYMVQPIKFLIGRRCPKCAVEKIKLAQLKSNDSFLKEVDFLVGNEYTFLEEYKGANCKILVKHNICNNTYPVAPHGFLIGRRCPFCDESNNEAEIRRYLINLGIVFDTQVRFYDCKNKRPLPFDFVIYDKFNNIIGIIEYDGEFHDQPARFIKDKREARVKLHHQQYNDRIKNVYCRIKNYPLLRIHYKQQKEKQNIIQDFLYKIKALH